MKKIILITTAVLLILSTVCGCSKKAATTDGVDDTKSVLVPEETGVPEETTEEEENNKPIFVPGETSASEEDTGAEDDEYVTIYLYDESSGLRDNCGWADAVLKKELGIRVEFVGSEYDNPDVIVWFNKLTFNTGKENVDILTWSDELLEEHGSNITEYLTMQMDFVTEYNDGVRCGFIGGTVIPGTEEEQVISDTGKIFTIAEDSKHIEEAMTLINWMADPENEITLQYGPKDLCWAKDEDGGYYLTEFGKKCYAGEKVEMPEEYGGGSFKSGIFQMARGYVWDWDSGRLVDVDREVIK